MAVNQVQSHAKGSILFSTGDVAQAVYLILDGKVMVTRGEEQILLSAGGILGDVAFFSEGKHTYTAICVTDVKTLSLNKSGGSQIVARQPLVALSFLRELALKVPEENSFQFFQGLEEETAAEKPAETTDVLPAGHPVIEGRVPTEYGELLFNTDVKCPVCEQSFRGVRTRTSRLQLAEQKPDFRNVYRNFEPNFFYIWVCPHCLFAYPERLFNRVSTLAIRRAKNAWEANPPSQSFEFEVPRTIQQVITSYYLAMKTFEAIGASPDLWANLWLRLVWIYEDLEEEELALEATRKAKDYFTQAMSTTARSAAGDQQLYMILGELALRLGDESEAFRNFHAAATMQTGDPRFKRMATDKIQDLRAT